MNFIQIFFILLLFFIDISCESLGIKIFLNIFNYTLDKLNLSLLFEKDFSSCFSSFIDVFGNNNSNLYSKVFRYTGKILNDVGDEKECVHFSNNIAYFTVYFALDKYDGMVNSEETPFLEFLNQKYFYMGFCFVQKCKNFFSKLVDPTYNEILLKFLNEQFTLTNLSLVHANNTYESEWNNAKAFSSKWFFKIMFYLFIVYTLIKIIAGFYKIINFSENYEQYYVKKKRKQNMEKNTIISNKNIINDDSNSIFRKFNNISSTISDDSYQEEYDLEPNFSFLLKTLKIFDLFDNLKIYSSFHNRYFNSKGIENLIILKLIFLFTLIYYYVMTVITKLPNKNFMAEDFYKNFYFFLVKFSIQAIPSLIFLDSAIFGYKFFNYLKKKKQLNSNKIKVKFFFKFILLTIPKIFLFVIIIIFFYMFSNHFEYLISNHSVFNYYIKAIEENTYCYQNKHIFFNPIKLLYLDLFPDVKNVAEKIFKYYFPSSFFNNCYMIVNVFYNEFICFILMLILIYLTLKIRKKLFDLIILILFILNFLFSMFFVPKESDLASELNDNIYTIGYVLGQNYSEKFTHLFLNYYFFGFIIGIIYFYYYDTKSKNSFVNELHENDENNNNIYVPFFYSYKLNIFFKNVKQKVKIIGIFICIFIIFINSLSFYFLQKLYGNDENSIKIKLNEEIKFVIKTEKNFFIFIFFILNIFILHLKHTTIWDLFTKFYLIYPFERITFSFICLTEPIIYLCFCILVFILKVSYTNIFYISIAMFSTVTFFSLLFTLMFEFPLKMLIINLFFRTNKNVENMEISLNSKKNNRKFEMVKTQSDDSNNTI